MSFNQFYMLMFGDCFDQIIDQYSSWGFATQPNVLMLAFTQDIYSENNLVELMN